MCNIIYAITNYSGAKGFVYKIKEQNYGASGVY